MFLVLLLLALPCMGQEAHDAEHWDQLLERFRKLETGSYSEVVAAGRAAIPHLAEVMKDTSAGRARFVAANAIGDIGLKEGVEPLLEGLEDRWFNVRRSSAMALAKIGDESVREPLEKLARDDPYVFVDRKSGNKKYLVREAARRALAILSGVHPDAEPEVFVKSASRPPKWTAPRAKKLPWPFPGGFKKQNLYNNYQQPTGSYVHEALDLLQKAGTEARAVESGIVRCISTNYPEWTTHHFFVVETVLDSGEGWCYTHLDPATFTVQVGSKVRKGQVLGKVVDFSLGERDGVDHLHLQYVRFKIGKDGTVEIDSLYDPLIRFDWKDSFPPTVHEPFLVRSGTLATLSKQDPISGAVDIIAGISDHAFKGHVANWMVPVVTLEIVGKDSRPWRKLVLDQRGPVATKREVAALYVSPRDRQRMAAGLKRSPSVYFLKVTNTDGDGQIESADEHQSWNTAALDENGRRRFPDGEYEIIVRAWDLAGNLGVGRTRVRVAHPSAKKK